MLLHGFPSSSREFDTSIPLLATRYHLISPDFPGFGQSDVPPPSSYAYTFDNLAKTINGLLEQLEINNTPFTFMTTAARSAYLWGACPVNVSSDGDVTVYFKSRGDGEECDAVMQF